MYEIRYLCNLPERVSAVLKTKLVKAVNDQTRKCPDLSDMDSLTLWS